ncbi:membrane protein, partial [Streptomyces sp. AcH 505]
AVTAARKLAARESAQAQLEAQEALDDPLVLAGRRLAGEAFVGEVTEVVMAYSESKRPAPRPLVTVRTDDAPRLGERTKVYRSLDGKPQSAEFVESLPSPPAPDAQVVLRLTDRMGRGKEPAPGSVPEKGDLIAWTLFEHDQRGGAKLPDPEDTPWTHGGPPDTDRTPTLPEPDPVTEEDLL